MTMRYAHLAPGEGAEWIARFENPIHLPPAAPGNSGNGTVTAP